MIEFAPPMRLSTRACKMIWEFKLLVASTADTESQRYPFDDLTDRSVTVKVVGGLYYAEKHHCKDKLGQSFAGQLHPGCEWLPRSECPDGSGYGFTCFESLLISLAKAEGIG